MITERVKNSARSRRSWSILLFGAVFILIGVQFFQVLDQVKPSTVPAYRTHFQVAGLETWATIFIIVGAISVFAAVAAWHTVGYTVLMGLSSFWGLLFVVTWSTTPGSRAGTQVLQWALITGILLLLSGWRDPVIPPKDVVATAERLIP